ncbi:MAG: YciI family protein [Vicinamibacteraceae bacterium]
MKQYLLSIYQPDGPIPPPEFLEPIMKNLAVLNGELRQAGAWVFAAGLHPPETATVVRARADEVLLTDGPFTEGKEHIGGFTVIRAADLDAALAWAGRLARIVSPLAVEVRPMHEEHAP